MNNISQETLDTLVLAARKGAENAYVVYSRFPVGAALLALDGEIYTGSNVENASYGLTNCAERTAVFNAVTDGRRRGDFTALVVYTPGDKAHPPCGACRQVLSEFLLPETPIYSFCSGGDSSSWTLSELLPDSFSFTPTQEY